MADKIQENPIALLGLPKFRHSRKLREALLKLAPHVPDEAASFLLGFADALRGEEAPPRGAEGFWGDGWDTADQLGLVGLGAFGRGALLATANPSRDYRKDGTRQDEREECGVCGGLNPDDCPGDSAETDACDCDGGS